MNFFAINNPDLVENCKKLPNFRGEPANSELIEFNLHNSGGRSRI